MTILVNKFRQQSGQALLIVVLIMVVALTVTLSLVSRSIVNLKTSVEQSSSQKALSAAEAGVEQSIKNNVDIGTFSAPITLGGSQGSQYSAAISSVSNQNGGFLVNGGNLVAKDEGAYVWLANNLTFNPSWPSDDPSKNADLYIYWGDGSGDDKNAALEIVLIYGAQRSGSQSVRFAFDPYTNRAGSNNFTTLPSAVFCACSYTVGGRNFAYRAKINISQGLLLRVNPLYYNAYVGVDRVIKNDPAIPPLPDQGQIITSSGCSPTCSSNNSVQRKITVYQGYPQLPAELFPYSLLWP